MGWLAFGLMLLALGLYSKVYEWIGWGPDADGDENSESVVGRIVVRCILTILGVIITAVAVPDVDGFSHPGLVVGGAIALYVALSKKIYETGPFQMLFEKDKDSAYFFTGVKLVALIIAILGLGTGIGTGNPDWQVESCEECEACEVVQEKPAPVKALEVEAPPPPPADSSG